MMDENINPLHPPVAESTLPDVNRTTPSVKPYDVTPPKDAPQSSYSITMKALWIAFGVPAAMLLILFPWSQSDDIGAWGFIAFIFTFFWLIPIIFTISLLWTAKKIKDRS